MFPSKSVYATMIVSRKKRKFNQGELERAFREADSIELSFIAQQKRRRRKDLPNEPKALSSVGGKIIFYKKKEIIMIVPIKGTISNALSLKEPKLSDVELFEKLWPVLRLAGKEVLVKINGDEITITEML